MYKYGDIRIPKQMFVPGPAHCTQPSLCNSAGAPFSHHQDFSPAGSLICGIRCPEPRDKVCTTPWVIAFEQHPELLLRAAGTLKYTTPKQTHL